MIDLWGVLGNSLWILGLAILLAALSWAYWAASTTNVRFRVILTRRSAQQVLALGLVLLCAGLAATSKPRWQQALWLLLTLAWVVRASLVVHRAAQQ